MSCAYNFILTGVAPVPSTDVRQSACYYFHQQGAHKNPWPESASDRRLSAKLVPISADRGVSRIQRGGSPTDEITFSFQVAPQLYSRG
jgi:hypothetical protein